MSDLLQAIARHAAAIGEQIAVSDEYCQINYASLPQCIDEAATILETHCPGQRPIGFVADNSAGWVLLDLAAVSLGRPLVPLPKFMNDGQCRHALTAAGAEWVITDGPSEVGSSIELGDRSYSVLRLETPEGGHPLGTAKITFTSGTTGRPKGVCLSQRGMEVVSLSLVEAIGRHNAGTHLAILPLAVLLENVAGLYATLFAGGHYRALSQAGIGFARPFQPDFDLLIDQLRANAAATAIMVPEILRGATASLNRKQISLPDLKFLAVGGAKVSPSVLTDGRNLGLPLYEGYGLSEAGSVVALNTPRSARQGSVGRPLKHIDMTVAADGEIIIRNPAFLGYVGGQTAPKMYPTGDIGTVDPDGYVFVHGRKSNVLVTSYGRNVSPEWVEGEVTAQPDIFQAMAFGDGAPALAAFVVPSSAAVTDHDIAAAIQTANRRLPDYAQVKHWKTVPPFTMESGHLTSNGRLRRTAIHETYGDYMNQTLRGLGSQGSFFHRLFAETTQQRNALLETEQIRRGLKGSISVAAYLDYLAQAYHHVRHTVPLMELTRARLPAGREWLAGPLADYIAEETGHEEWILDDIRNAGGDARSVRNGSPRMATEFMVAYAYDYVSRINAVGFFGMVFVLENTSTQLATAGANALMKSLGLPADCFSYLTSHGSLDLEHMKFFEALVERIDHVEDQDAIVHMAQRMYVLFANVFRGIPLD